MWLRTGLVGVLIWTAGTAGIRAAGHHVLRAQQPWPTVLLYLVSFALMAWLVPIICRQLGIERASWFKAATLLILPTLLLDPFSCLFFTTVFPNLDVAAAGAFGGWMLICCGGAVAGVWAAR
jgi:predicted neutral ceramidase superfamily lipid hydrolase